MSQSMHGPRDIGRFIASVVALGILVVGVPVGLILAAQSRFNSGNPLSGTTAPWRWSVSDVGNALSNPLADDNVIDLIIRLSICVIWLAAVVILVSTAIEMAHMIRHRGLAMPSVRGFGWAQQAGRFIAIGLLIVIPVMSPRASIASGSATGIDGSSPVATRDVPTNSDSGSTTSFSYGTPGEEPEESVPNVDPGVHVVQAGESVYSIAADLSGGVDSRILEVANSILELNLGNVMTNGQRFTSPAYIEVGWELSIPAHLAIEPTFEPREESATETALVDTPESGTNRPQQPTKYVVQPGDTLWGIAEEELGDATAWPEIWNQNAGRDMGEGRTFDDPNLILPGWDLEVGSAAPTPANPEPGPTSSPTTESTAPVEEQSPATSTTDPTPPGPTSTLPPAATAAAVEATTSGSATVESTAVPTTTSTTIPAAGQQSGDASNERGSEGEAPDAPSPIRIEHAALLAAGILALVAVRRRQRLRASMPRSRVPEPRDEVVVTEKRLRTIDAGERAARVDVACRAAASALVDGDAQIGWVRVTPDGDVALRLTGAAELPPPWGGVDQDWVLAAAVPIELLSEDARRVGMPSIAFVQLGVTDDGDDVLVDLEACGVLAIEAKPTQADEVITAIATGLASSMYAEVAHLITVSLPEAAVLSHRNAHRANTVDAAFELAVSLVGSTLTDERTSFALRSLRTGGEVWEPAIILLNSDDDADQIATNEALPPTGHGLAVVAAAGKSGLPTATSRLLAEPAGWTFHAFGDSISLSPIGLSQIELDEVVEVLADATGPLENAEPAPDQRDDASSAPFEPMPYEIVVRLMGSIDVIDRDGSEGQFERSKTVELIAWLATHRDRGTRTGARTALWELDVRDATFANVVSEARRALGRLVVPADGEEWLARTLTEQLPIHDAVVTDSQLMQERLDRARAEPPTQAIETLRPAVEMIRDMPFAGTSYLWPDAEGITSNLVLLAISVSSEFAAHALSVGDTDAVFWATGQGLKVLPGHEELIGLRMRAHARAGDLAGVRQEWESYERVIVADSWSDGEPAPKLLALRRDLLTTP